MADAAQIAALAERVEKLDRPDREVDRSIYHDVLGFCRHANTERTGAQSDTGFDCLDCGADSWGNKSKLGDYPKGQALYFTMPHYTASLDAAITLVPEGWSFSIIVFPEGHANAAILEFRQQNVSGELKLIHRSNMADSGRVQSATPALALCAAALLARAQQEPSDGE